eukprot:scaffold31086_cov27-Tisochrysis_lutea.AAC.3
MEYDTLESETHNSNVPRGTQARWQSGEQCNGAPSRAVDVPVKASVDRPRKDTEALKLLTKQCLQRVTSAHRLGLALGPRTQPIRAKGAQPCPWNDEWDSGSHGKGW